MSTDFELFPGKNLSGLFEDIYNNQINKKKHISDVIYEMRKMVSHKGDMGILGPIIKDLIDTSVRNDESLIKMAAIAQRMIGAQNKAEGDAGFLTDKEKELKKLSDDKAWEEVDDTTTTIVPLPKPEIGVRG